MPLGTNVDVLFAVIGWSLATVAVFRRRHRLGVDHDVRVAGLPLAANVPTAHVTSWPPGMRSALDMNVTPLGLGGSHPLCDGPALVMSEIGSRWISEVQAILAIATSALAVTANVAVVELFLASGRGGGVATVAVLVIGAPHVAWSTVACTVTVARRPGLSSPIAHDTRRR